MPTPRRLAVMGAGVGTAAIAVLILLMIVGAVRPVEAVVLGLLAALLGGLAFLVLSQRRLDGKVLRLDARAKREEQRLTEIAANLAAIAAKLDSIAPTLAEAAVQHDEDLRAVLASLGEDRVNAMFVRREIEAELQEIRRRTEAMASPMDRVDH